MWILEKTKDLKAPVESYYKSLKFTPSQFRAVGGLRFLDSLVSKLNEMLKSKSDLDLLMKPLFDNLTRELSSLTSILEEELSSLSSIFRDFAKVHHEHEILKDFQRRTISLAYEAEVSIDSILVQYNVFWHIFCSLPTILKEIKQINAEMTEMWSADVALKHHYVVKPSKHLPCQHSNPVSDDNEIVGFEIATEKLIRHLTRETSELDVIPIVGIGEQEKTTIARKVYDKSCKLFHKKVFQTEDCPLKLQGVSQRIAEKCKGLPLVAVLVAGIIKKRKMEESWWNKVKDGLFHYLDPESEAYSRVTMQLSFDNLSDCLKPFLYMGMFREDSRIRVSKLVSLWIEEGFVQDIESAEYFLMDLISSNVVMVSNRGYNGKVKYCQVHDVVLHFCLEKSREENFMLAVKGHLVQFQPSEWKGSRVSFSFSKDLSKFTSLGSKTWKPFHQHLRSLIMTNDTKSEWNSFCQVSKVILWNPFRQVSEVRLLKVLDLSSFCVRALSSTTLKPLIHLKYLAVEADKFHFHPEPHLPHLVTLIVSSYAQSPLLTTSFWKMKKLRHVEIYNAELDLEDDNQGIVTPLFDTSKD
ncbi:hypothetical protein CQW23_23050 [Capsicum baccatum]|uniref:Disease resistance protein winged helix domain-containing protein n=1 Tax=Capsicum baccatum TaxID=33114 RepID=A0A2G2W2L2_CAPBA|nr:hypothetical protein CQW23_23050 [Capsicum baccatum]